MWSSSRICTSCALSGETSVQTSFMMTAARTPLDRSRPVGRSRCPGPPDHRCHDDLRRFSTWPTRMSGLPGARWTLAPRSAYGSTLTGDGCGFVGERREGSCGLTVRALAARAGVAGIDDHGDPGWCRRPNRQHARPCARGGGLRPSALGDPAGRIASTASRRRRRRVDEVPWPTRSRSTGGVGGRSLDDLALHPERVPEAIYSPPPPAGEPCSRRLAAATAEKLADDAGLTRPSWDADVPWLYEPYRPPLVRTDADRPIPPQLAARGRA